MLLTQTLYVNLHHSNILFPATKSLPLKIIYYNARSLLPKMDELATIAEAHSPDLICIVETWLSDISDTELSYWIPFSKMR